MEVEVDAEFIVTNEAMLTRVGWTPFAGMRLFGRVQRVFLRGEMVYEDGVILAQPGSGKVLFAPN